jgi:hypothetical protein
VRKVWCAAGYMASLGEYRGAYSFLDGLDDRRACAYVDGDVRLRVRLP